MRFHLNDGVGNGWALIYELLANRLGDGVALRDTQPAINLDVEINR